MSRSEARDSRGGRFAETPMRRQRHEREVRSSGLPVFGDEGSWLSTNVSDNPRRTSHPVITIIVLRHARSDVVVAGSTQVASWPPQDVAIGPRPTRRWSWIRAVARGELRVMWQERLPGAMLPHATPIRPGHGDRPRRPTRACQR
jgi:hypothetical protein